MQGSVPEANHQPQVAAAVLTVREMLFPGGGRQNELLRKKGIHSLQTIMDAIGYAQNIQIRLLRPYALKTLDEKIMALVTGKNSKTDVQIILKKAGWKQASHEALYDKEKLKAVHDWMQTLQTDPKKEIPGCFPNAGEFATWLKAMAALLPHIERKVWLTAASNPLPAHALCRMQNTWGLFVLLHLWQRMQDKDKHGNDDPAYAGDVAEKKIDNALGIPNLIGRPQPKFALPAEDGEKSDCVLLVGPAFEISEQHVDNKNCHKNYKNAFKNFNHGLKAAKLPQDLHSTVSMEELTDALVARIEFPEDEVKLRGNNSIQTLQLMLDAEIDPQVLLRHRCKGGGDVDIFERTDWYSATVLANWLIRWGNQIAYNKTQDGQRIGKKLQDGEQVLLHWGKRRIAIIATYHGMDEQKKQLIWDAKIIRSAASPPGIKHIKKLLEDIDNNAPDKNAPGFNNRIDRIEILYNRMKERQNAAWTRQVIAVNNLLLRHGSNSTEWGPDDIEQEDPPPGAPSIRANQVGHLLKGFGPQICKYLADIARADLADIFWLDYSQEPPRLIHAGGYARTLPHIVQSDDIFRKFDAWALTKVAITVDGVTEQRSPAEMGKESVSQAYRVIATGKDDPGHDADSNSHNEKKEHKFHFDCYRTEHRSNLIPEDAMALPLLVNKRTIGALLLGGLVPGQFNRRLLTPLRTIAGMVAETMYHQSQLWQMRRLNALFTKPRTSIGFRKMHTKDNNGLKDVVRCLTNIFLCPAVQIWLSDAQLPSTYKLCGYNWPNPTQADGVAIFNYQPTKNNNEFNRNPETDGFISLAIDLWWNQNDLNDTDGPKQDQAGLAQFVQGHYDKLKVVSEDYNASKAGMGLTVMGQDFLPLKLGPNTAPNIQRRHTIFCKYGMRDMMAFALVRPKSKVTGNGDEWEVVGAITLHDKGVNIPDRTVPWDNGWCPVVAHMQTYLPYLFTQAEVLSNPVMNAHKYLLHAGRATLRSAESTAIALHDALRSILAPDHSVRHAINELLNAPPNSKDPKLLLQSAPTQLSEAWTVVQNLKQSDWIEAIDSIADIMLEPRDLVDVMPQIVPGTESFFLHAEIMAILKTFSVAFKAKYIEPKITVAPPLEIRARLIWLRIVMRDLIHNAAKYAMPSAIFEITWHDDTSTLEFKNEGFYDPMRDIPAQLLQYGIQGSNLQSLLPGTDISKQGAGIGLWGSELSCRAMGIGFEMKIVKQTSTRPLHVKPTAWFSLTLKFQESMRVRHTPPPAEYY